jgi:hypothetical protein
MLFRAYNLCIKENVSPFELIDLNKSLRTHQERFNSVIGAMWVKLK